MGITLSRVCLWACVCVVLGVCEGDMCSVFIFNAQVEVNAVA